MFALFCVLGVLLLLKILYNLSIPYVLFSPTSSGKTFVGEMAAVRVAHQCQRVIYLVPQKVLAEEKYRDFKRKYSRLGVRVVVSTRDHKESDRDIQRGRFHIAVVVFEKLRGLMISYPRLMEKVGLVVIDELQMIGDKSRGPDLEILLTKIKMTARKAQIIGVSAVLGSSAELAKWLGARLCTLERRPIELRKGVLHNGVFRYVEHNSGLTGEENLGRVDDEDFGVFAQVVGHVRRLAEAGEQSLVFCKSKQDCIKTALAIAKLLRVPRGTKALDELHILEDSNGRDLLTKLSEPFLAGVIRYRQRQ